MHNEEFHSLYSVAAALGMIREGRMKWEGYVACMRKTGNAYKIFIRELNGRDHLRYLYAAGWYCYK
jgi:hypothetical protein